MNFTIIDTQSSYRRLLAAQDAAAREAIFYAELVAPFAGLIQKFGGGDGVSAFKMWGMSPDQFAPDNREKMTAILDQLAAADAWNRAARSLDKGWTAFAPYADRIALSSVIFGLLVADMSAVPQARGYTGFGGIPGWIMTVYDTPDAYNLQRVEAATVHELHHNIAGSTAAHGGNNMMIANVGNYMVGEGLAESFSAELYGADKVGPWVTEFDVSHLEQTKMLFHDALNVTGFNEVRRYIFGDQIMAKEGRESIGVPLYAGYALGYRLVQQYLKRTGKTVPEATFVPARDIIAESGYFA